MVTLVVDGEAVDLLPLPLTRLTISDQVRTEIEEAIPASHVVDTTVTQELLVLIDGKLERRTQEVTEQTTVHETRTASREVRIPGEFKREGIYHSAEPNAHRNAFAPSDKRTIFFGTNRAEVNPDGPAAKRFGASSIPADMPVSYGAYQVSVPQVTRKRGEVNQPKRWWLFWREKPDPEKHFVILDTDPLSQPRLTLAQLQSAMSEHDTVLYVHGFNNTFEDAMVRAAQLQHDLRFGGNMMVFSWPSAGKLLLEVHWDSLPPRIASAYDEDKKKADQSVPFLADTLMQVMNTVRRSHPDGKVHVIAHSMGNHVLLKALGILHQKLEKAGDPKLLLGEVILAAPDVAGTDFVPLHQRMAECCERVTFYCASDDKALIASRLRNLDKPIGLVPLVLPNGGMDTIQANGTTETFYGLGHSYFGDSDLLLADLSLLLTLHRPPLQRRPPLGRRIEADLSNGGFYFELAREWLP